MHPLNAKFKKQTPRLYVILSEGNARDEVLVVQQSGTDKTRTTCRDLRRNLRYPFNSKIYFRITWDFVRRKTNFYFGTIPPARGLATSLYTREARVLRHLDSAPNACIRGTRAVKRSDAVGITSKDLARRTNS